MSASLIVEPAAVKFSAVVSVLFKDLSRVFCVEPSRPLILFKLFIVTCRSTFALTAPSWVEIDRPFYYRSIVDLLKIYQQDRVDLFLNQLVFLIYC